MRCFADVEMLMAVDVTTVVPHWSQLEFFFNAAYLQHGMSALHYAANAGHLDIVKVLLVAKANVNTVDEVS